MGRKGRYSAICQALGRTSSWLCRNTEGIRVLWAANPKAETCLSPLIHSPDTYWALPSPPAQQMGRQRHTGAYSLVPHALSLLNVSSQNLLQLWGWQLSLPLSQILWDTGSCPKPLFHPYVREEKGRKRTSGCTVRLTYQWTLPKTPET